MIGYKIAEYQGKRVLITLEIPQDARTNCYRNDIVDPSKALYRCDKAFVIKIQDDTKEYTKATSLFSDRKLHYVVGKEIYEPNYNEDIHQVSTEGIHFCLDKERALLYGLESVTNGMYQKWYDNGHKQIKCSFYNDELDGLYEEWWPHSGQKRYEHNYKNGKLHGLNQSWYCGLEFKDKQQPKDVECTYENGLLHGLFQRWYSNGKRECLCNYKHGNIDGLFQRWNRDGTIHSECTYDNGTRK